MAKILVIEDNATLREGVVQVLQRMGHEALSASSGQLGVAMFKKERPALVISDLKMDGMDGMDVLRAVHQHEAGAMVMIITAFGSIERAVEAMQAGAFDFIPKPFPPDLLRAKVERALRVSEERRAAERLAGENAMLRADADAERPQQIIGEAEPMRRIFAMIGKIARTESTVYVFGESGTGKELVARAIHDQSARAQGPFIKVNCGALAESLLESELFGHEKGAFTGAHRRKLGRFELAHQGTLFLDEIGDISPAIQLKLLRVIQERQIERVGGEETLHVDVRIVTATNKDLQAEVAAGRFREDLFYRLHIIPLSLPPLRDRREDIPLLVDHFVAKLADRTRSQVRGVSSEAMQALLCYRWPGNVRELENVLEHAMVFAEGDQIAATDLPPSVTGVSRVDALPQLDGARALPDILDELEHQLILRAYRKAQGVKTETARLLGIKPSALYYKLEKYSIDEGALA